MLYVALLNTGKSLVRIRRTIFFANPDQKPSQTGIRSVRSIFIFIDILFGTSDMQLTKVFNTNEARMIYFRFQIKLKSSKILISALVKVVSRFSKLNSYTVCCDGRALKFNKLIKLFYVTHINLDQSKTSNHMLVIKTTN